MKKQTTKAKRLTEAKRKHLKTVKRRQLSEVKKSLKKYLAEGKLYEDEGIKIADFLNANYEEVISSIGPATKFSSEITGDNRLAFAGLRDDGSEDGIEMSFDKDYIYSIYPEGDPYNEVEEITIAGKTVYYNDYRGLEVVGGPSGDPSDYDEDGNYLAEGKRLNENEGENRFVGQTGDLPGEESMANRDIKALEELLKKYSIEKINITLRILDDPTHWKNPEIRTPEEKEMFQNRNAKKTGNMYTPGAEHPLNEVKNSLKKSLRKYKR